MSTVSEHITHIIAAGALAMAIGVGLIAAAPILASLGVIVAGGAAAQAIAAVGAGFMLGAIGAFFLGWAETFQEQVSFYFSPCLLFCNIPT